MFGSPFNATLFLTILNADNVIACYKAYIDRSEIQRAIAFFDLYVASQYRKTLVFALSEKVALDEILQHTRRFASNILDVLSYNNRTLRSRKCHNFTVLPWKLENRRNRNAYESIHSIATDGCCLKYKTPTLERSFNLIGWCSDNAFLDIGHGYSRCRNMESRSRLDMHAIRKSHFQVSIHIQWFLQ